MKSLVVRRTIADTRGYAVGWTACPEGFAQSFCWANSGGLSIARVTAAIVARGWSASDWQAFTSRTNGPGFPSFLTGSAALGRRPDARFQKSARYQTSKDKWGSEAPRFRLLAATAARVLQAFSVYSRFSMKRAYSAPLDCGPPIWVSKSDRRLQVLSACGFPTSSGPRMPKKLRANRLDRSFPACLPI